MIRNIYYAYERFLEPRAFPRGIYMHQAQNPASPKTGFECVPIYLAKSDKKTVLRSIYKRSCPPRPKIHNLGMPREAIFDSGTISRGTQLPSA